jgi:uncharacterized protein (DUF1015 family)
MATLHPFRALRPDAANAPARSRPGDVVSTDEARTLADGNPLSFSMCRAQRSTWAGTDPYADAVSEGRRQLAAPRKNALVIEEDASVYFIAFSWQPRRPVMACFRWSMTDIIKKTSARAARQGRRSHQAYARARGADRPVFLTYRAADGSTAWLRR